jgi:hypothetical protein
MVRPPLQPWGAGGGQGPIPGLKSSRRKGTPRVVRPFPGERAADPQDLLTRAQARPKAHRDGALTKIKLW